MKYIAVLLIARALEEKHLTYVRQIKSDHVLKHLPIVVMIREDSHHLITNCIIEGVEYCFVEPIHPLELNLKYQRFAQEKAIRGETLRHNLLKEKLTTVKNTVEDLTQKERYKKNLPGGYILYLISLKSGLNLGLIFLKDSIYTNSFNSFLIDHIILSGAFKLSVDHDQDDQSQEAELTDIVQRVSEAADQEAMYKHQKHAKEKEIFYFILHQDQKKLKYVNVSSAEIYCEIDRKKKPLKRSGKNLSIKTIQHKNPIRLLVGDQYIV